MLKLGGQNDLALAGDLRFQQRKMDVLLRHGQAGWTVVVGARGSRSDERSW
jgi:hypothetical protein